MRRKRKTVITFIIAIMVIGHRKGYLSLDNRAKIWNKRSSTLKPPLNATVVTAFFDIGPIKKRQGIRYQTEYFKWAEMFRYMRNALVVYTDSEPFRNHITSVRSELSWITEIFVVNRSMLWSFQNLPKIAEIYNSKPYSKYNPKFSPLYTCVMHSKYDLLLKAAKDNVFKTKTFMWLDIGYFRHRKSFDMFHLTQPKHFNNLKIAMNQVQDVVKYISPNAIVKSTSRYVGGGLIYGERVCVIMFAEDFKRAVQYFLSKKIINTDEQILSAMITKIGKRILKPTLDLQLYRIGNKEEVWFYLGNSMITEDNISHF